MASIKKNFVYQIGYQLLISILPFITSPYISRVLGADGIGIYSYTFSIVTYFKIFAALGIVNYGNRSIAQSKDDKTRLNRTFSSLVTLHILLASFVSIIYVIYLLVFPVENRPIASIQMIYLIAEMVDINWFFFGMEKFQLTVTRNALIKIISAACIFLVVKTEHDLWKYVLILAAGTLFSNLVLWLFLPKYVKLCKFTVREMLAHIRPMLILFFAAIAVSIFSYMDKIMIGAMSSMAQLGYYENAWKMIEFPAGLITALSTVMLPQMAHLTSKGDETAFQRYIYRSMRFSLITSFAIAFGVAGIAKDFSVMFWGANFINSGIIMIIMAPTIVIMAFNSVVRGQYLIPREHDKVYLVAVIVGAIINLIMNSILIPGYGGAGAGVATVISYIGICLVQMLYAFRHLNLKPCVKESLPYAGIAAVMFAIVNAVGSFLQPTVLSVLLEVVLGVALMTGMGLAYAVHGKDQFVLDQLVAIKTILKL